MYDTGNYNYYVCVVHNPSEVRVKLNPSEVGVKLTVPVAYRFCFAGTANINPSPPEIP